MNVRKASLFAFLAASTFTAPSLLACSGSGAIILQAENKAEGTLYLLATILLLIPLTGLRFRRFGLAYRTWLPLAVLVIHPLWVLGSMGDCGGNRKDLCLIVGIGILLFLVRESVNYFRKPVQAPCGNKVFFGLVSLPIIVVVGWLFMQPWKYRYLPNQKQFMAFCNPMDAAKAQAKYFDKHGVYADSATILFEAGPYDTIESWREVHADYFDKYLGNADSTSRDDNELAQYSIMLQGTIDNPTAWQVDGGLSKWAFLTRTDDPPNNGEWMQYLFLSDGTVWSKPDPANGKYLLKGLPASLEENGWELQGELDEEMFTADG